MDNITYTFTDYNYDSIVIERDNIIVDGAGHTLQGTGSETGIDLSGRSNVTIKNIEIKAFKCGVFLTEHSNNNTLSNNRITENYVGVTVTLASESNVIEKNVVTSNEKYGIGILAMNSRVISNFVMNNEMGIFMSHNVHNSTIAYNTITRNEIGIYVDWAADFLVFHNNLINNTNQVITAPITVTWDDGYPSGGNYWSDYSGADIYSGPYQNVTGCDGIGDTPYFIDENNQDNYPLMEPWPPVPTVMTATVGIDPDTLNLRSKRKWVTCYIELPEGHDANDINTATIMLNDTVSAESFPVGIGDHDGDGIPDLMVKFSRSGVIRFILANLDTEVPVKTRRHACMRARCGRIRITPSRFEMRLTVTGKLFDGTPFEDSDTIRVLLFNRPILILH